MGVVSDPGMVAVSVVETVRPQLSSILRACLISAMLLDVSVVGRIKMSNELRYCQAIAATHPQ